MAGCGFYHFFFKLCGLEDGRKQVGVGASFLSGGKGSRLCLSGITDGWHLRPVLNLAPICAPFWIGMEYVDCFLCAVCNASGGLEHPRHSSPKFLSPLRFLFCSIPQREREGGGGVVGTDAGGRCPLSIHHSRLLLAEHNGLYIYTYTYTRSHSIEGCS